ncbi:MAG: copper transporter [Dethiobacteria bacterium]|jgi:hypothetical protein
MDQQQNYLFSLIAVFLALGIGILIGASMGENALVTNQIAVIEELKNEIRRHKEEVETQFLSVSQLKEELLRWESLEEDYFNPLLLQDKLRNVKLKVIVQDNLPADLEEFLDLSGCSYQAFIFAETNSWPEIITEEGEDFFASSSGGLLLIDTLELVLLGEENIPLDDILKRLEEKNLLWVKTDKFGATFSSSTLQKQTYDREFFMAYGHLDPLCLDLVHKIRQKGETVLWVNAPEDQENQANTPAELKVAVSENMALDSFYNRLKLLEILQVDN